MFVNKNGQKIGISDIPISWLCPTCWSLICDYCHAAKTVDRVSLDPTSDKILSDIKRHSNKTKNPILRALFRDIKIGVRTVLNQTEKESRVFSLLTQLPKNA